jgi:hypothetical protein
MPADYYVEKQDLTLHQHSIGQVIKHNPLCRFIIPVAVVEQFGNDFAEFECCDNGIVVVRLDDELYFNKENAVIFMEAVKKAAHGKIINMLLITGAYTSADNDSRSFFALPAHKQYIGRCAAVINSMSQRMVGNFFLRINKPIIETHLFSDPMKAWNWLVAERSEKR